MTLQYFPSAGSVTPKETTDPLHILEFLGEILLQYIDQPEYEALRHEAFYEGTPHCGCLLSIPYSFYRVPRSDRVYVIEGGQEISVFISLASIVLNLEIAALIFLRGNTVLDYNQLFFPGIMSPALLQSQENPFESSPELSPSTSPENTPPSSPSALLFLTPSCQ